VEVKPALLLHREIAMSLVWGKPRTNQIALKYRAANLI